MGYKFPKDESQKVFDAIVDVNGLGDYTTIKSAFDAGARKILIRDGNYTIDEDILQPSTVQNIYLEGERNVKITLDIPSTNYDAVFDFYTNRVSLQTVEFIGYNEEHIQSYDSTTRVLTVNTYDPSSIFSAGDQFKIKNFDNLGLFTVEAVDATSLTISDPGFPFKTVGASVILGLMFVKRPPENTMSSFSMKNLTFIEAETNGQYLFGTNGSTGSWFSETIFENCHFYGKSTGSNIFGYDSWIYDRAHSLNCVFDNLGPQYWSAPLINCKVLRNSRTDSLISSVYGTYFGKGTVSISNINGEYIADALLDGLKPFQLIGCYLEDSAISDFVFPYIEIIGCGGTYLNDVGERNVVSSNAGPHASSHDTTGSDAISLSGIGAIPNSEKGVANGVAELDANGKINSKYLFSESSTSILSNEIQSLIKPSFISLPSLTGIKPIGNYDLGMLKLSDGEFLIVTVENSSNLITITKVVNYGRTILKTQTIDGTSFGYLAKYSPSSEMSMLNLGNGHLILMTNSLGPLISDDDGDTFTFSSVDGTNNFRAVVDFGNGRVRLYGEDWDTESLDYGETWGTLTATKVADQLFFIKRLGNGNILFSGMNPWISTDNGETFSKISNISVITSILYLGSGYYLAWGYNHGNNIQISSDFGLTWRVPETPGGFEFSTGSKVLTDRTGYVISYSTGYEKLLAESYDFGINWTVLDTTSSDLVDYFGGVEYIGNHTSVSYFGDTDEYKLITRNKDIINLLSDNIISQWKGEEIIYANTTSAPVAIEMSLIQLAQVGRKFIIKDMGNASVNNVTITTEGAETIDGQASLVLSANYTSVILISNGTNWFII